MRMIRGRCEARWLPSRHNFALFRLVAWLRLRSATPEPCDALLVVDRHQSAFETGVVAAWIAATVTAFTAAALAPLMPVPVALLIAFPVAMLAIEVPMCLSAALLAPLWSRLWRQRVDRTRFNGAVVMTVLAACSMWATTKPHWVRFAGWQFLAVLLVNAIAAVAVFFLREPIARLEASIGGVSSER